MTLTILQAEDDDDAILLFNYALNRSEMMADLQVVHDGEEAISYLLGKAPYDDRTRYPLPNVVVIDLNMPKRDGFQVLEWIRSQPQFDSIPVYVLSVSAEGEKVDQAMKLGATGYFTKAKLFVKMIDELKKLSPGGICSPLTSKCTGPELLTY